MTRQARGSQEKEGGDRSRKPEVIWDHLGSSGIIWEVSEGSGKSSWKSLGRLWGSSGKALG